ncbi:MAG: FAD-dependent monooxygenase [Chloroflexi bacterium]|nr:FAD-dependent monooxygenase [Chloroflexota bacterium]
MRVVIVGAGPAGLYAGLLIKKANPACDVTIIERNPADVTYGWGVVFSDRTLSSFQRADYKTYTQITDNFVIWDAIDVRYRGETIRCGGHVIASIARKQLLNILQRRCAELGVALRFNSEVQHLSQLPEHDLLIAADGINSLVRKEYESVFKPTIELGKARYIWLGANKVLDAFNFIFHENEDGLFNVHAYPFSGDTSTFIVECDETTWLNAGLDRATEDESLVYCRQLLAGDLGGETLLSNNSKWINFPTLKTRSWHHTVKTASGEESKVALVGDAAHTAHFSIGSGTKLAMEDAITLATALESYPNMDAALNEYELERKPVVEVFQRAAQESMTYFETIKRYLGLTPMQFAFQLLTRSGRITYDDLHFRDVRFGDALDRWYTSNAELPQVEHAAHAAHAACLVAPPPIFAPLILRGLRLSNRVVALPAPESVGQQPISDIATHSGAGLIMINIVALSAEGRITPCDSGLYEDGHLAEWAQIVGNIHEGSRPKVGVELNHAGRRGSTRPPSEGLDRPLREGNWPLLSASPIPYTQLSQVPREMDRTDMDRVHDDFVRGARMADEAGFDLLQLNFAQGYLLASFLSPLTNLRRDQYGGSLEKRMRYPLEVFSAVRERWPQSKPISVSISAADCARGGAGIEDAVVFAAALKEQGCDLVTVQAGQTTISGVPAYGRGFLTSYSDRIRNEAHIPTMVGGYLTNSNDINTILAAGRADLCVLATG